MRGVITLLVLLAATIGLMLQIREDSGYVLLSYGSYSIETSLVVLLVALGLGFVGLYFLFRSVGGTWRLPSKLRQHGKRRRRAKAAMELQTGLLQLSEGSWTAAQRSLVKHVDDSGMPVIHFLSAARAAQLNNDAEARDQWLAKAYQASPQSEIAIGLAKAELQMLHKQHVQALATLRLLHEKSRHHPYVLRLLALTHMQLNEWQELEQLLPEIEQAKAFDKKGYDKLRSQLWAERLNQITELALSGRSEIAAEHIDSLWAKASKQERQNPERQLYVAKAWHACGRDEFAANLIEPLLKQDWNTQAVELYGWLQLDQKRALKSVDAWQKRYGDKPALLLTAARVCIRFQLWGRARSWLSHLVTTHPSEAAWRELAALEEQQGNHQEAIKAWRSAATMSGKTVTPLLPQSPQAIATTASSQTDSNFKQPDVAGPECIEDPASELERIAESAKAESDDQLELPVTPAAAYSNESKNS